METDVSNDLRIVLLVIGALIVLSIYIMARIKDADSSFPGNCLSRLRQVSSLLLGGRTRQSVPGQRVAPQIGAEDDDAAAAASVPARHLLVLYVQAEEDRPFSGAAIAHAAERVKLQRAGNDHSRGFFQYTLSDCDTAVCVTNHVEPGLFIWSDLDNFSTTTLSVFAELQATDSEQVLDGIFDCANRLADILGGRLLDEDRQALTTAKIRTMREAAQLFFTTHGASREA